MVVYIFHVGMNDSRDPFVPIWLIFFDRKYIDLTVWTRR